MFSIMGSVLGKKSKSHGGLWENSFQEKLGVQLAFSMCTEAVSILQSALQPQCELLPTTERNSSTQPDVS